MKKNYLCLSIGILLLSISAFAQKTVVVVQPDAGIEIGALNNAITNATDPGNTIFELKRGGFYYLNGAISHAGYTLHIRAEQGTGSRPILQPANDDLGESANPFNPGGSLTLEGLHILGFDELGANQRRLIIVSGEANQIIIDDCYVDHSNQTIVRLGSSNNNIFIKNSVIRNSLLIDNPNNGRIIDTRGNVQDTLSIENCTVYNCGSEFFSSIGSGFVKMAIFNHNTVFQMDFRYSFSVGQAFEANVTNNIFYNFAYAGINRSHAVSLFEADSIFTIGEYTDANRSFDFSNNNWYIQPEISDIFEQYSVDSSAYSVEPGTTDTTWHNTYALRTEWFANQSILDTAVFTAPPALINFIAAGQVDTTNLFKESLTFKNPPSLNLDYWKFYCEQNFSMKGMDNIPDPYADEDLLVLGEVETGAYDFSYNSGSRSATAAEGGLPLGASQWVPYDLTSARKLTDNLSSVRTYPNPTNGKVTFEIESKESTSARIIVSDLLGKQLMNFEKQLIIGNNRVSVNLDMISKPGIYFYQVQIGSSGAKSVVSGKLIKK